MQCNINRFSVGSHPTQLTYFNSRQLWTLFRFPQSRMDLFFLFKFGCHGEKIEQQKRKQALIVLYTTALQQFYCRNWKSRRDCIEKIILCIHRNRNTDWLIYLRRIHKANFNIFQDFEHLKEHLTCQSATNVYWKITI